MAWKNWPYWLKGGIIGFFVAFIIVMGMFFNYGTCTKFAESELCGPFMALIYPQNILFASFWGLLTFIPGALIGWIYGKVKRK